MPWVKLDDNFDTHPKLVEVGPQAAWVFVRSLCYSNRHLTNGVISKAVARDLAGGRAKLVSALVSVGLWQLDAGGYRIHDYLDYQPSREEILRVRETKAAAGRVGGIRSGEVRRGKAEAEREAVAKHDGSSLLQADPKQARTPVPVPVPKPDRATSSLREGSRRGNGLRHIGEAIAALTP
jgi:hypothetical protein